MGWHRNVTVRAQQCDGSALAAHHAAPFSAGGARKLSHIF